MPLLIVPVSRFLPRVVLFVLSLLCVFVGKESRSHKTGLWVKKSDWKKAYVRLLHPFPFPTIDEQRKISAGIKHEPQEFTLLKQETEVSAEERAQKEAALAAIEAQKEAEREKKEQIRAQVAENLAKVKAAQAQRIRTPKKH